jgi:hypothetical protein
MFALGNVYVITDACPLIGIRSVAQLSSRENRGHSILSNVQHQLEEALGEPPASEVNILSNRNVGV